MVKMVKVIDWLDQAKPRFKGLMVGDFSKDQSTYHQIKCLKERNSSWN